MPSIRIKGIKKVRSRHGTTYYYHRKTGARITSEFGTPEFLTEVRDLDALEKPIDPRLKMPGTFGWLLWQFKCSEKYTSMKPSTKADYESVYDFLSYLDLLPLAIIKPSHIRKLRDSAHKQRSWRFSQKVLSRLNSLYKWGMSELDLTANPAASVIPPRRPASLNDRPAVNRPWDPDEIKVFFDTLENKAMTYGHRETMYNVLKGVAIGYYTLMREADIVKLRWSDRKNGVIKWHRSKDDAPHDLWEHEELTRILELGPKSGLTIVTRADGKPLSKNGFYSNFRDHRDRLLEQGLVKPGLTMHGLRHTAATYLATLGHDEESVAAVTGHTSNAMARHYSRQHERRERAKALLDLHKIMSNEENQS